VQNYIRAQNQRPLENGARERIVYHELRPGFVCDIRDRSDV
jgi:hypothetical protein